MRAALLALSLACAACAGAPAPCAPPGQACDPARLYRARCTGCHRAYEPASRSRAQWRAAIGKMAPKAHLTPEDAGLLEGWLEERASDGSTGGAR